MRHILFILLFCCFGFSCLSQNILVFTKTGQYRHASIPNAIKAFVEMGEENAWKTTFTEDASFFTSEILNKFDVVVFLLTNKNILSEEQKNAFKEYIRSGGGCVGVHSATVTEMEWPWFGQLIGARFMGHSGVQKGRIIIENNEHPSTKHFAAGSLAWEDEWYGLDKSPRESSEVLISLDENSIEVMEFEGKNMAMEDHPIAWCHEFEGGRVFQTQLGHLASLYDVPEFRKHLVGAVLWAGN